MTRDGDIERVLDLWLADGPIEMPDRFFGQVLQRVDRQPQQRLARLPLRSLDMHATRYAALGAAALLILAVVAFGLGAGRTTSVPSPSPVPSAAPVPSATSLPADGPITPGRYAWDWPGGRLTFAVPAGWTARADGQIAKHEEQPNEVNLAPALPETGQGVTHVYGDACLDETLAPVGPTVADLVAALDSQVSTDVTVTDVTIGGRPAYRIEMVFSPSVDPTTCRDGAGSPVKIWADHDQTVFFAFPLGTGSTAYLVDVDGERIVFFGGSSAGSGGADTAEVEGIVDSMAFEVEPPYPINAAPADSDWPGMREAPAGTYAWLAGRPRWMHNVSGDIEIRFGEPPVSDSEIAVSATYARPTQLTRGRDQTWVIDVNGERTFMTIHASATTTGEQLAAAEAILRSVRHAPTELHPQRLAFELPRGWDSG
jgi:hypothetical protein